MRLLGSRARMRVRWEVRGLGESWAGRGDGCGRGRMMVWDGCLLVRGGRRVGSCTVFPLKACRLDNITQFPPLVRRVNRHFW